MVLADPVGSGLASFATTGRLPAKMTPWQVEGIGGDTVPPVADFARVTAAYSIPDAEAFRTCRELLAREGIIAGTSTGTLLAAALRYCRAQREKKRVVSFVCDSGNKYLSKVYNDYWMLDQGFLERAHSGDLRDLIARPHSEHAAVTVNSTETVMAAYRRMKLYDVSQVPVMESGRIIGIVDEEDIHRRRGRHPAGSGRQPRALQRAGDPRHGESSRDRAHRCAGHAAHGDLQARHGCHRHARQRVPGTHHTHRPAQLAAAQALRQTARTSAQAALASPMPLAAAIQRFASHER
jgi:hypothetical protein